MPSRNEQLATALTKIQADYAAQTIALQNATTALAATKQLLAAAQADAISDANLQLAQAIATHEVVIPT